MASGQFVSSISGYATLFGLQTAGGTWLGAAYMLTVPVAFFKGAVLSQIAGRLRSRTFPYVAVAYSFEALCLVLIALGGERGALGTFGDRVSGWHIFRMMYFLSFVCGFQNGLTSSMALGSIRTTHFTGHVVELANYIAQCLLACFDRSERQPPFSFLLQVQLATLLAFPVGCAMGAWCYTLLGYEAFFIPAFFAALASVLLFLRPKIHTERT
jgi:uncharacterized membrane protein YoaK (UPF0700 family)